MAMKDFTQERNLTTKTEKWKQRIEFAKSKHLTEELDVFSDIA